MKLRPARDRAHRRQLLIGQRTHCGGRDNGGQRLQKLPATESIHGYRLTRF
jgi:hypothetical protein